MPIPVLASSRDPWVCLPGVRMLLGSWSQPYPSSPSFTGNAGEVPPPLASAPSCLSKEREDLGGISPPHQGAEKGAVGKAELCRSAWTRQDKGRTFSSPQEGLHGSSHPSLQPCLQRPGFIALDEEDASRWKRGSALNPLLQLQKQPGSLCQIPGIAS